MPFQGVNILARSPELSLLGLLETVSPKNDTGVGLFSLVQQHMLNAHLQAAKNYEHEGGCLHAEVDQCPTAFPCAKTCFRLHHRTRE